MEEITKLKIQNQRQVELINLRKILGEMPVKNPKIAYVKNISMQRTLQRRYKIKLQKTGKTIVIIKWVKIIMVLLELGIKVLVEQNKEKDINI